MTRKRKARVVWDAEADEWNDVMEEQDEVIGLDSEEEDDDDEEKEGKEEKKASARQRRQACRRQLQNAQGGVVDLTLSGDESSEDEVQEVEPEHNEEEEQDMIVEVPSRAHTAQGEDPLFQPRKKPRKELNRKNPADLDALIDQTNHHQLDQGPLKPVVQQAIALATQLTQLDDIRSCFTSIVKDQDALDAKIQANTKEIDAISYRFASIVHDIAKTMDENKLQERDLTKKLLVDTLEHRKSLCKDWIRLRNQRNQLLDRVATTCDLHSDDTTSVEKAMDASIPDTIETMYIPFVDRLLDSCLQKAKHLKPQPDSIDDESDSSSNNNMAETEQYEQVLEDCKVLLDQAKQMRIMVENYLEGLSHAMRVKTATNCDIKDDLDRIDQQLEQCKREEDLAKQVRKNQREKAVVEAEIKAKRNLLAGVKSDLAWADDPKDVQELGVTMKRLENSLKGLTSKLHKADVLMDENRSILEDNFPELLTSGTKEVVLSGSFLWETGLVDSVLDLEEFQMVKVVVPDRVFEMIDKDNQRCAVKKLVGRREVQKQLERLVTLANPLIVSINRVFLDMKDPERICYMQMPLYDQGNLRGFVDRMKTQVEATGSLDDAAQFAEIQCILGQIAHALVHLHGKGIVHRKLHPENVLLKKSGQIALCGFGKSSPAGKSVMNSTTSLFQGGKAADYVAPEAAKYRKKCDPSLDMWSFGCMMLELLLPLFPKVFGNKKFRRSSRLGQVAAQEIDWSLLMASFQTPSMKGYVRICSQLLRKQPDERPSASELLLEHVFKPGSFVQERSAHIDIVARALSAVRPTTNQNQFKEIRVPGTKDVKGLCRHCLSKFDPESNDFSGPIRFVNGRGQAQDTGEVMYSFFNEVALPRRGLFTQSLDKNPARTTNRNNESTRADRAYLPTPTGDPNHFRIVGMLIGQCLLQGIRIPLLLNRVCIDFMLGRGCKDEPWKSVDESLAFLNETSDAEETLYRNVLRERQNRAAYPVEVGVLTGSESEQFVTDDNKSEVICEAIWTKVVANRRQSLEYLAQGFAKVAHLSVQLQPVSSKTLQHLFFGSDFVQVDLIKQNLDFVRDSWPSAKDMNRTKAWLIEWMDSMSDVTLRVFMAKCFHSFSFDSDHFMMQQTSTKKAILVAASTDEEVHFPSRGVVQLPSDCASFESLDARLRNELVLVAMRSDAENLRQLSQQELMKVVGALQTDVRRGAWYRCPNGHLYAVGNCGGVLEGRRCPSCNAQIGGQNYQMAAGNTHATIDGASAPAYPNVMR